MVSDLGNAAAVTRALDNLTLDAASGDTGLEVENEIIDGPWVQLTSMRDGLKRPPIPRIHAERVMAKKLSDGSPAFWIEGMPYSPPEPRVGSIKCFFHPDFDEADGPSGIGREFIIKAGLGDFTCNSGDLSKKNRADFKTVMQRDAHMQSRHRRQLEAVQKAQGDQQEQADRAERQLEREYQRQQTEAMLKLLAQATGTEVPAVEPVAPIITDSVTQVANESSPLLEDLPSRGIRSTRATKPMVPCPVESCDFEGRGNGGVKAHMRMKIRHGDEAHVNAEAS